MKMAWAVLTIRLAGADRAPESVVETAERVASGIFARAGIRVEWVDCRSALCTGEGGPQVQLIAQSHGAAGYAVVTDPSPGYAVVRYPVVEAESASLGVDTGPALGAVIAHEVGHLLLGKAHGRGVMSPRLGREEMTHAARGELGFTPREAARLHERLR